MVIACVVFRAEDESGIGNPTHLTSRPEDDQALSFSRWTPDTPPSYSISLNRFIFPIMCIGPCLIQVASDQSGFASFAAGRSVSAQ